ncbi:hypothetical protein GCM10011414_15910 [Croceivirga lutea]|uniref:hypothetical protein n=1 Tax=Croceivirga lutea TaxID=1775167 RepID=UPI00163B2FED|nr:hypothetical protein [Croceivirga lutea]GGG47065.1 hypothetical protein GCM10011414_15910 [Croceivirga lutea]
MKRWMGVTASLIIILVLTSFGTFNFLNKNVEVPDSLVTSAIESLVKSKQNGANKTNYIKLDKNFIGFKEALGFKESQGRYDTINRYGYLGKYQFGKNTLQLLGINDTEAFLLNAEMQEKAFKLNVARNKWILRRDIKRFVGKNINGTLVTESGMVAAAHLAGAGNVKKYLRSYGRTDFSDKFGSTVAVYLRQFEGYDISNIPQENNPQY